MIRTERLSIIALAAALALTSACTGSDCKDAAACGLTAQIEGLDQHEVQGQQSVIIKSGGVKHALVHVEYGVGQDCPAGCFYSHLCTFVVDGELKPLWFSFTRPAEVLPSMQAYCAPRTPLESDTECALPGLGLPIIADAAFRAWALTESNDEFRWCRQELASYYRAGTLPR